MELQFGLPNGRQARAIARAMQIDRRHVCRPFDQRQEPASEGCANPELAARAIEAALADAGLAIGEIGYLIGHTTTPLQPLPSNIALVADLIGYQGPHAEFRQACAGFANALAMAFGLLSAPDALPVMIVGSETGSLFFDPVAAASDDGQLVNLVQMGDGAAAVVVGRPVEGESCVHCAWYGSIGLGRAPGLQMRHNALDFVHDFAAIAANGGLLFDAGRSALEAHGHRPQDADIIIPHQVSGSIGHQLASYLGVPADRMFVNGGYLGNTGSAAIWMALAELRDTGIADGTRVMVLGAEATKYMHGGFVYDHVARPHRSQ